MVVRISAMPQWHLQSISANRTPSRPSALAWENAYAKDYAHRGVRRTAKRGRNIHGKRGGRGGTEEIIGIQTHRPLRPADRPPARRANGATRSGSSTCSGGKVAAFRPCSAPARFRSALQFRLRPVHGDQYTRLMFSPRRPPRLDHIYQPDPLYFVTCCTHNRQSLLAHAEAHNVFRSAAQEIQAAGNAVGRYVIMPDHWHLFIRVGPSGRLSLTVKHLKERMTKALRRNTPGLRVWQEGFFDHLLRSSESYGEKWDYVRMNPVRAGLASKPEDWPYQGEIVVIRW